MKRASSVGSTAGRSSSSGQRADISAVCRSFSGGFIPPDSVPTAVRLPPTEGYKFVTSFIYYTHLFPKGKAKRRNSAVLDRNISDVRIKCLLLFPDRPYFLAKKSAVGNVIRQRSHALRYTKADRQSSRRAPRPSGRRPIAPPPDRARDSCRIPGQWYPESPQYRRR